jgi:MFS family permease
VRRPVPLWIVALSTTLGMQSVTSFLNQSLPIIAPLLMVGAGLAPERIGNLSSLNSIGAVLFLMFGGPLLVRWGPVRSLQFGGLIAVLGLGLAATGMWPLLMLGAFFMGIGYGPSPPAGSRILSATAPPAHRTLIFSIKQAGAPAGGAVAGLVLAPIAAHYGWPVSLAVAMGLGVAAVLAIGPMRRRLDVERVATQRIGPRVLFNPRLVVAPFRTLAGDRAVLSITTLAFSFAAAQGCLFSFSITYLVTGLGMSLSAAGIAYATLQACGVFARIFLGWLADRTGSPAKNLTAQAFVASGMLVVYASLPIHPSAALAALICGATGFVAASWNGIYMAEIARLAPPERIVEATSSSSVVTFLGYVSGPSLFTYLVTVSGSWTTPFLVIAAQLAAMACVQTWFLLAARLR